MARLYLVKRSRGTVHGTFQGRGLLFIFLKGFRSMPFSVNYKAFPRVRYRVGRTTTRDTRRFTLQVISLRVRSTRCTFSKRKLIVLCGLSVRSNFFRFPFVMNLRGMSTNVPICNQYGRARPFSATSVFFGYCLSRYFFLFRTGLCLFEAPSR